MYPALPDHSRDVTPDQRYVSGTPCPGLPWHPSLPSNHVPWVPNLPVPYVFAAVELEDFSLRAGNMVKTPGLRLSTEIVNIDTRGRFDRHARSRWYLNNEIEIYDPAPFELLATLVGSRCWRPNERAATRL